MSKQAVTGYPLSHPQKRIWYIEKLYPGTPVHNIGGVVRIKGRVDFSLLEEAIHLFIQKNEGIRLQLKEEKGSVSQYVQPFQRSPLRRICFSSSEDPEGEMNRWAEGEFQRRFPLYDQPLYDFAILQLGAEESAYFIKLHHLVSDGWTILLLTDQIHDFYMKLQKNEPIREEPAFTYMDYLQKEQTYLRSHRCRKDKNFWNRKFSVLPERFLHKSSEDLSGKRRRFQLDGDRSRTIRRFAEANGCSLNTLFVSLMLLYLNKVTQENDLILGIPVLNRSGVKEKKMVGMFTSTMPFRASLDDNQAPEELIRQVNRDLMQCFLHQKYPYDLLVQDLELNQKGYDQLFQVCVNYYNTKLIDEIDGMSMENVEFYNGSQIYSLQLVVKEWSNTGRIDLYYDYKRKDYTDSDIERMHDHMMHLLEQMLGNPRQSIRDLQLLTEGEQKRYLYELNRTEADYPKDQVIQQLFEEQVARTPDRIAVESGAERLTYRQLDRRSNQLARLLRAKGVGRDGVVGLLARHSPDMVAAILAVIKAGGAYVPIDPEYPDERIQFILEDSRTSVLLTNLPLPADVSFSGDVIRFDDPGVYTGDSSTLELINQPADLVYMIYTSGSTGLPKGTQIEHQGLVNYIWWARTSYVKGTDDAFALYSSIAFDLTVTSIFTPLISGVKVVVYAEDGESFVLRKILNDKKATVVKLTPAHLSLLSEEELKDATVRRFIVGGDDLKTSLARKIDRASGGRMEVFNEYGPTETVVGCMIHRFNREQDTRSSVSLGFPIQNVQIYLLDPQWQPVPAGTAGEIYISGDGVARGYWNRPELQRERFVENPFIPGRRMYKTGDLAVRLPNDELEYIGRSDFQVKIRGYRIELGEIESQLLSYDGITDAVVIDRKDEQGKKQLVAYIVGRQACNAFELRRYLSGRLPSYMIPASFVSLDALPLSPNGKVDRNALPSPESQEGQLEAKVHSDEELEAVLIRVIAETLGVTQVKADDNFYLLGGDSIKAIQIVSKLQEHGFHLKTKDVLTYPVIRELGAVVERRRQRVEQPQVPVEGYVKRTPISAWFFAQRFTHPHHWHQSLLLDLKRPLDPGDLSRMMDRLIRHHDSLRLRYDPAEGKLFYHSDMLDEGAPVTVYDLSSLTEEEQKREVERIGEEVKKQTDLEKGPLFQAVLFQQGSQGQRLLLTAHHLLVDGVSWRVIMEDLAMLWQGIRKGEPLHLPSKTRSFQDFAEALEAYGRSRMIQEEIPYWQTAVEKITTAFPPDDHQGAETVADGMTVSRELGEERTKNLLGPAHRAYHTQPNDLLLTALARTCQILTGQNSVSMELEGHGREAVTEDLDVSRTVGWFTAMFPVTLHMDSGHLAGHIKSVKEQLRRVPNKGIGYGLLADLNQRVPTHPRPDLRFNYLGEVDASPFPDFEPFLFQAGRESFPGNQLSTRMEVIAFVKEKKLRLTVRFSRHKYRRETMERFMDVYMEQIDTMINHCCGKGETEFTPSDFDAATVTLDELDALFEK
ncbi:non-ribosomal peptide synthetase [Paludifilum halophilum]|uniref:Carrier domain-containing protein n=1 Tax=Paludifilum halophilum TaxID=1642702 RepID=A0A235B9W1_9BACL|nr:non-ribosomal peptide synthetase [Paludifilum halophilum]OYD09093.1 hypothetical protein CHM34_04830 [Paludifilum halophilum]